MPALHWKPRRKGCSARQPPLHCIRLLLLGLLSFLGGTVGASDSVYGPRPVPLTSASEQRAFEDSEVANSRLVVLSPFRRTTARALVLVGGYGNDYRVFEPWLGNLIRRDDLQIFGLAHDHSSGYMTASARRLASLLEGLKDVSELTLFAHSMGGLVAKAALHELASRGELARFERVDLHTFGTPFGGYRLANLVRYLPGGRELAAALGYPMSADIGSGAPFMRALARPLPPNIRFYVYDGAVDRVSIPRSVDSLAQYAAVLESAHGHQVFSGMDHDGFFVDSVLLATRLN